MKPKVTVIGAGIGGLSAAVRLAAQGCQVHVLEQFERAGGKLGLIQDQGFSFDTGPSLVTLPWVFEELFQAAGERLEDHLKFTRLEPVCRYFYPPDTNGQQAGFDASADLPVMMRNLERFSPGAGEDFMAFFGHAARAWRGSRPAFLERMISNPLDFVRDGVPWTDLSALLPWPNLHALAKRFFKDPRMQQFVGRYATYTGSSPYRAPATLSSVLYSEYAFGAWYVQGGLYEIARAFERIARKLGVTFEFGQRVQKINTTNAHVHSVTLNDGRQIECDNIICNADATQLYDALLETKTNQLEPSLSAFVILLGLRGQKPGLAHHNVFFSDDYPLEFKRIFDDLQAPENPSIYVSISSKTDPTQAPEHCENWFVLVNAPPTGRVDWSKQREPYAQHILKLLASRGFDVRPRIITQQVLTPNDLETRTLTHRGGIYGSSSNTVSSAFLRPKNRSDKVKGLYLATGSAHPGGGLPLVMLSGKLAANALLEDWAITNRSAP